jgi:hypothetical protein
MPACNGLQIIGEIVCTKLYIYVCVYVNTWSYEKFDDKYIYIYIYDRFYEKFDDKYIYIYDRFYEKFYLYIYYA